MKTFFIGVILTLIGSVVVNIGTNILKLAFMHREKLPVEDRKLALHDPLWRIGFLGFAAGNILNFCGFAFAPASILAALGSIQFVSNVICSKFMLKEHVAQKTMIGTFLILVGNGLMVGFGDHNSTKEYTVEELRDLYKNPVYHIFAYIMLFGFIASYVGYKINKYYIHRMMKRMDELEKKDSEHYRLWNRISIFTNFQPFLFIFYTDIIGSQSVMFAKSISVLLRRSISLYPFHISLTSFKSFFPWLIVFLWITFMCYWTMKFNTGIRKWSTQLVIPVFQLMWTVLVVVSGGIYFKEFEEFGYLNYSALISGIIIIVCGVLLLTPTTQEELEEEKQALLDGDAVDLLYDTVKRRSKGFPESDKEIKDLQEQLRKRKRQTVSTWSAASFALQFTNWDPKDIDENDNSWDGLSEEEAKFIKNLGGSSIRNRARLVSHSGTLSRNNKYKIINDKRIRQESLPGFGKKNTSSPKRHKEKSKETKEIRNFLKKKKQRPDVSNVYEPINDEE